MPSVYAIQLDLAWEDQNLNHARAEQAISAANPPAGSMVVLPEMFDVGFTMNVARADDGAEGPTRRFLARLARERSITLVAGFVSTDDAGRPANRAMAVGPDGLALATYSKVHPFTPAGEHEAYAAGRTPIVFEWAGLKVAPLVCYDLRFPELFRAAVDLGAEAFVVIANWPTPRADHWSILARARAIENLAYVVAVNRAGRDPKCDYPGRSVVVSPKGEVLAEAGNTPTVLSATLDPNLVRDWRRDFPALRDRVIGR